MLKAPEFIGGVSQSDNDVQKSDEYVTDQARLLHKKRPSHNWPG